MYKVPIHYTVQFTQYSYIKICRARSNYHVLLYYLLLGGFTMLYSTKHFPVNTGYTVHSTFSNTTVQLQNSIHFWGTVHTRLTAQINICSLFLQLLSHSTIQQPEAVLTVSPASARGCQEKEERERGREGGGGSISQQKQGASSHHCTVHIL